MSSAISTIHRMTARGLDLRTGLIQHNGHRAIYLARLRDELKDQRAWCFRGRQYSGFQPLQALV